MSDLRAAVRDATERLSLAGVPSPGPDAVALAAHLLGVAPAEVRRRMVLGAPAPEGYAVLVAERAARVPLQHLTGRVGFRRLVLEVGPGVFVPRPETECVAGWAVEAARAAPAGRGVAAGRVVGAEPVARAGAAGAGPVVVDLCTGSGAIALAVKDEVPSARVYAVELSDLAHAWALRNRDRLRLDVDLLLGDAATALPELDGGVDVVVANPPYIPPGAMPVDPEVRDHDPEVALYGGGPDGLRVPLAVAARAAGLLRPGGVLVMEHADTQGRTLPAALRRAGGWREVADREDLTGRPRAVLATRA
ncbi:MAG TPA: peptide chain release factor N(5)-glutamine methyltransferase [Dermatophilaceae bacterium]|nr:peptide chain release factor N(5)-glutamine methyltransferase [Dermatophilaceae bacterium]